MPVAQDASQSRLVVNQEASGRAPKEDLDAWCARQVLILTKLRRILGRRPDEEPVVTPSPSCGPQKLVLECLGIGSGRISVGHLKDRCDAPVKSGASAALQVLLVFEARLAEMDLSVDHPRHHP